MVVPDTDALLKQVAAGDRRAKEALLHRHRDRLRRMVSVRMDQRVRHIWKKLDKNRTSGVMKHRSI